MYNTTMSIQHFVSKVSETRHLNDKFVHIVLELVEPSRMTFTAGQYILLEVPGIDQKKSYSIASAPGIDHRIELLVDISPQGPASKYLDAVKPGDEVSFFAPAGRFIPESQETPIGKEEKSLVFVATGSGIAPLRGMIFHLLQEVQDPRPMTLYWGLRKEDDLIWADEFQGLSKSFPQFTFHPVLSRATDAWPLCRGRVTDCLLIHPFDATAGYYLCGNRGMIEDVSALLLDRHIQPEHIHREQFD